MLFAAVHESLVGPTRTCWHVRYCAAIGRQADIERALIAALGTCATCGRCSDPRRLCQTVSTLLGLARKSGLSLPHNRQLMYSASEPSPERAEVLEISGGHCSPRRAEENPAFLPSAVRSGQFGTEKASIGNPLQEEIANHFFLACQHNPRAGKD